MRQNTIKTLTNLFLNNGKVTKEVIQDEINEINNAIKVGDSDATLEKDNLDSLKELLNNIDTEENFTSF